MADDTKSDQLMVLNSKQHARRFDGESLSVLLIVQNNRSELTANLQACSSSKLFLGFNPVNDRLTELFQNQSC